MHSVFAVDGSNSMDCDRFYNELLDFTLKVYCALPPNGGSRAGMVLFNNNARTIIPLAEYTRLEWFTQVNNVRLDNTLCGKCCTPTAEAFDESLRQFQLNGVNTLKTMFMLTDGVPYQIKNGPYRCVAANPCQCPDGDQTH